VGASRRVSGGTQIDEEDDEDSDSANSQIPLPAAASGVAPASSPRLLSPLSSLEREY
jgi:hypothetical protein